MNQPDRIRAWVIEDGESVMEITEDPKLNNAITVIFRKQDHTLGGMLRSQLLLNPAVLFAGYRVPHPLETNIEVRLQTDGIETPRAVLQQACSELILLTRELKKQFNEQAQTLEMGAGFGAGLGGGGMGMGLPDGRGQARADDLYGGVGFGGVQGEAIASQQPEDPYAF